jgi:hypothetical protein
MMAEGKNSIYAVKERLKTSSTDAVMKRTSFSRGTNDKLTKQFA